MRSIDPLKDFPELDGLDPKEAGRMRRQTQRQVALQPKILAGLLATTLIAAIAVLNLMPTRTFWQNIFAFALVGVAAVTYMVLIVKPRMKEIFRQQGFPRK